jgi:peptidoglycan/xylan/chitin deacetylase (PgdA/CDA1 family)
VTFDDGNCSDIDLVLPALLSRKLTGIFFIVAGRLNQSSFVSVSDLRSLAKEGMMIGTHGMSHIPWVHRSESELRQDLVESRDLLEQSLGSRITVASCPHGAYNRRVIGVLRREGYSHIYTSDGGRATSQAWLQQRNTLHADVCDAELQYLLSWRGGASSLIRSCKLLIKRWR